MFAGWRFWVVACALLVVNTAGWFWVARESRRAPRIDAARVVQMLPERDIDRADRLTVLFDKPLAAPAELGLPLAVPPFLIEPPIPGDWVWSGPQRLDYVFARPLPPGREYKVLPAANLELLIGQKVETDELTFATKPLALETCVLTSVEARQLKVELLFNQPVQPTDLERAIRVSTRSAGVSRGSTGSNSKSSAPLVVRCLNDKPASRLVVQIERGQGEELLLTLAKGLAGYQATRGLETAIERHLTLPAARIAFAAVASEETPGIPSQAAPDSEQRGTFALLRATADAPGLDELSTIEIDFSEEVPVDQPVPQVEVTPPVKQPSRRFSDAYYRTPRLVLEGDFAPGQMYSVKVAPTVRSRAGRLLHPESLVRVSVPERSPSLRFQQRDGILSPAGNLQLDLRSVNVRGVRLTANRLYANNLVSHLHGEYSGRTSRKLVERTLTLDDPRNLPVNRSVDLKSLVDQSTGIYRVDIWSTDDRWIDDSVTVTITDIGLTVKKERNALWVWATSLTTGRPLAGTQIVALSTTNQSVGATITDEQGIARLPVLAGPGDDRAFVITAARGHDMAFLRLQGQDWATDDFDVSGRVIPETYDVMVYPERGVYRPGDTIHLTAIIRDKTGETPPAFPLLLKVSRPDGKSHGDYVVQPGEGVPGIYQLDVPTRPDGQTGRYRVQATLPGADSTLGSAETLVEAFVPVRVEVKARPTAPLVVAPSPADIEIDARYLFGQPCAGLPVTSRGHWVTTEPVTSETERDFTFGPVGPQPKLEIREQQTQLDAQGHATLRLPAPAGAAGGMLRANLFVTVTEPGGRSVSTSTQVTLDLTGRHIGLRLPGGRVTNSAEPVAIEWIARTGLGGAAAAVPLSRTLYRVFYEPVWKKTASGLAWSTHQRLEEVSAASVAAGAGESSGRFDVICPVAGRYRLRVASHDGATVSEIEWSATADDAPAASFAGTRPERLQVVLDRTAYEPGTSARVAVTSPIQGLLLVCLETDRVQSQQLVEMTSNTAVLDVPVPAGLRGGAFVTASVIRAVDPRESQWLPHRAFGITRLPVSHEPQRIEVSIEAPATTRPGSSVPIKVRVKGGLAQAAGVHLWAVDEGILQTTAYRSPDPFSHFLAPRRLGVSTSDVFSDLMPDYARPGGIARIGGDGDESRSARTSPVATRRREPVVVWQTVRTVSNGILEIALPVPQFTGELRLMATAVAGDNYGSAQAAMTVTQPLLVESTWPRAAAPGDEFEVPVRLFSSHGEPVIAHLSVAADGPADIALPLEEATQTVVPGVPQTVWMRVRAQAPGPLSVRVTAHSHDGTAGEVKAESPGDVTVRYGTPLMTTTEVLAVDAGEPLVLPVPEVFDPATVKRTLTVSASANTELQPAIDALLDYPYGCVEQTSSRIYGLLAAREVLQDDSHEVVRVAAVDEFIRSGIVRLSSMQVSGGGLGYWPGSREADSFGTAYAAGALQAAERAGFDIPPPLRDDLTRYLSGSLGRASDNERARMLHVLAGFGKPDLGWMAAISERIPQLDIAARAELAAAWLAAGRRDRAREMISDDTLSIVVTRSLSGRLTSQTCQEAVLLQILLELDAAHKHIPVLVQKLQQARSRGAWLTTLENAASLTALARYQRLNATQPDYRGELIVPGESGPRLLTHAKPVSVVTKSAGPFRLTTRGSGRLHVLATATGLPQGGTFAEFDHGLRVRRQWQTPEGEPVDLAAIRVGDLLRVELTVESLHGSIPNLAIVDALPGGLEIENPRLATSLVDRDDESAPDHVEFLDDRVLVFLTGEARQRSITYLARATTSGTFSVPPVQGSCMYDETVSSVHGAGRIVILPLELPR